MSTDKSIKAEILKSLGWSDDLIAAHESSTLVPEIEGVQFLNDTDWHTLDSTQPGLTLSNPGIVSGEKIGTTPIVRNCSSTIPSTGSR